MKQNCSNQNRWFNNANIRYFVLLSLGLFTFVVAVLITAVPYPDDQDGVNFILGIERYDLDVHQPHFPGYPVYITAGKFLANFTVSPEWALVTLSVVSAIGCGLILFVITRRQAGEIGAVALSLALFANPVFFEFSHRIYSEMPGLLVLLGAFLILGKTKTSKFYRFFFSGILIGLTMGIRLSWWPYTVCYIIYSLFSGSLLVALAGIALGTAVWLVPLATYVGLYELINIGIAFTSGHFETWGGAMGATTASDSRFLSLATRLYETLWLANWGPSFAKIPWMIVSVFGLLILAIKRKSIGQSEQLFIVATVFYLVWAYFGQNLDKARHFIPVIPALLFCLIPLAKANPGAILLSAFALSMTIPLTYESRVYATPPVARLSVWLDEIKNKNTVLYCGQTERFFDRYRSSVIVRNVESVNRLQRTISSELYKPDKVFVCDDIPKFETSKTPVVIFEPRLGDPVDKVLHIYEWKNVATLE